MTDEERKQLMLKRDAMRNNSSNSYQEKTPAPGRNRAAGIVFAVVCAVLLLGVGVTLGRNLSPADRTSSGQRTESASSDADRKRAGTPAAGENAGSADDAYKEAAAASCENNIRTSLQQNFGNNFKLTRDGETYTIKVWEDGVAVAAVEAASGNTDLMNSWKSMTASINSSCSTFVAQLKNQGLEDANVSIMIVNDQNRNNVLFTSLNGVTLYDSVAG